MCLSNITDKSIMKTMKMSSLIETLVMCDVFSSHLRRYQARFWFSAVGAGATPYLSLYAGCRSHCACWLRLRSIPMIKLGKTSSQAILHEAYQETWVELLIQCDEVKHGMEEEYLVSWSTTRINVSLSITRYK